MWTRRVAGIAVCVWLASCRGQGPVPHELTGRVLSGGAPAAGATVRLLNSALTAVCDDQGEFALGPLASATYGVVATTASGYAAVESIRFDTSTGVDVGDVPLGPVGSVRGTVTLSGHPVAGAILSATDAEGRRLAGLAAAVADDSGAYTISGVPAGPVMLQALFQSGSETFTAPGQQVQVMGGATTAFDLILASPTPATAGTITGDAVFFGGVDQVSLVLSRAGAQDITASGAAPSFSLANVPPGLYALGVTADGLAPVTVPYVVVGGPVDLGAVVFTQTQAGAVADCPVTQAPTCMAGQPGCDPDDVAPTSTGIEVNAACQCSPGDFLQADGTCINECLQPSATCDVNATCIGGTGVYYCTCNSGFEGDGKTCSVIQPEINELVVMPELIGDTPGGQITATFQANEFVPAARVLVTVGSWPFTCTEMGSLPWIYVCTYSITGQEIPSGTNSLETVTATITNSIGGSNSATGFVDFDFRLPQLTSLDVTYPSGGMAASPGSDVTVSFMTDRALSTAVPPIVTATLGNSTLPFALQTSGQMGATLTATVPAGTAAGSYQLRIVLTDSIGNVNTIEPMTGVMQVAG